MPKNFVDGVSSHWLGKLRGLASRLFLQPGYWPAPAYARLHPPPVLRTLNEAEPGAQAPLSSGKAPDSPSNFQTVIERPSSGTAAKPQF